MTSEFAHIKDPAMLRLYQLMHDAPYEALSSGERLLKPAKDGLAVLEAMRESIRVILEDLDEHGSANRAMYGNHGRPWFEKYARRIDGRIRTRTKRGDRSRVFSRYRRERDVRLSRAAGVFISGMDADESAARRICAALQGALSDADRFLEGLEKLQRVTLLPQAAAAALTGLTSNALREQALAGRPGDACRILEAYGRLLPKLTAAKYREELAGNAIHVVLAAGRMDLAPLISEGLIPPVVKNARLAFNLACLRARQGDKKGVLRSVSLALRLGKEPEAFLSDPDFEPFRADPDFLALLP